MFIFVQMNGIPSGVSGTYLYKIRRTLSENLSFETNF